MNKSTRKQHLPFTRTASLIGGMALAVASGAVLAQQSVSAQDEIVTSTDEMQRLAREGKPVPEGQLNRADVVRELGEEQTAQIEQMDEQSASASGSASSQPGSAEQSASANPSASTGESMSSDQSASAPADSLEAPEQTATAPESSTFEEPEQTASAPESSSFEEPEQTATAPDSSAFEEPEQTATAPFEGEPVPQG
jgi:hypothetical protein